MKANESKSKFVYPDKLYARTNDNITLDISYAPQTLEAVEYTRTDAFIEKALKWYCLDCECNDNCKDTKCFFYREYERYLKGETNALPPKISGRILDEDGSTSDNWRYRHFTSKMQDAFIEKAAEFLYNYNQKQVLKHGARATLGCGKYTINVDEFRKYMEGE